MKREKNKRLDRILPFDSVCIACDGWGSITEQRKQDLASMKHWDSESIRALYNAPREIPCAACLGMGVCLTLDGENLLKFLKRWQAGPTEPERSEGR